MVATGVVFSSEIQILQNYIFLVHEYRIIIYININMRLE
jgi:hypothetical protein